VRLADLGYLRAMFAVDDLDDTLARLREHGAQLVDEVVQDEDVYRLCYVRGPGAFSSGRPSKSADANYVRQTDSRLVDHPVIPLGAISHA
jgi:hypothetical protein